MQKLILLLFLLLTSAIFAETAKLPIALLGRPTDFRYVEKEILQPGGMATFTPENWLTPADYGKYSAIYIGEALPKGHNWKDNTTELLNYVNNGGTVILSGGAIYNLAGAGRNLAALEKLLGFAYCPKIVQDKYLNFEFTAPIADIKNQLYDWHLCSPMTVDKITTAKVMAYYNGETRPPALTVNQVGKGKVYWIGPLLFRLSLKHRNLGDADENGEFILNEAGQSLNALAQLYIWIFSQISNSAQKINNMDQSKWGTQPLGEAGNLSYSTTFKQTPEFRKPQPVENGFALSENGTVIAEIVAPRQFRRLANELKYHLDLITGGDFPIVSQPTNNKNAIILVEASEVPKDTAIAITREKTLTLSGNGAGPELAAYYLLEKLGCRYLWPGVTGKVIPRTPSLNAPILNLHQAPKFTVRRIRNSALSSERNRSGIKNFGFEDIEAIQKLYKAALIDHPGNASFYLWHGQGGGREYRWGHFFSNYYKRFGKQHPDFFALQANGSRSQDDSPDRPRLCHSNMELIRQTAADCLEIYEKNPNLQATSIALPDGGRTKFCLCEECRKLDPVNAAPITLTRLVFGVNQKFQYVALTDRVLSFSNHIAELVTAKMPDRQLTIYAYSAYEDPPVKVKPHPALMIFCTAMKYTDIQARERALSVLASWSNLTTQLYWRPNALWGFKSELAPQNYARKMFDDTELLKANGLKGTDFDCNEQMWSCKGLIYYTLSKALWNPDRLSYDDIVADYCHHAFGAAANELVEYFNLLEVATDRAATEKLPYLEVFDKQLIKKLQACLRQAMAAVNDPAIHARIKFFELGLKAGEMSRKMYIAEKDGNLIKYKTIQNELRQFIQETYISNPMTFNPGRLGRLGRTPYIKKRN